MATLKVPVRWYGGAGYYKGAGEDDRTCYDDLELDPVVLCDGRVETHDEDEFIEACSAGLITAEESGEARAAADWVEQAQRDRKEPFGRKGWERLEAANRLALRPITELRHVEG